MKCPLFVVHAHLETGRVDLLKLACLKEECAWWQGDDEVCWIVQIGIALSIIASKKEVEL